MRNGDMMRSILIAAAVVGWGGAAAAQPSIATPVLKPDIDGSPSSRNMIAALKAIKAAGITEAALRANSGQTQRSVFQLGGQDVALLGSADAQVPRLALAPGGQGVAFVIKLPSLPQGVGSPAAEGDAAYALATVTGTKVLVWTFLREMPSDKSLTQRILKALAVLEKPLATFDPNAQPAAAG